MRLPKGYWLAHPHWVRQAEREGRGRWEPAALDELGPDLAFLVEGEIMIIAEAWGASRAPSLWKRVAAEAAAKLSSGGRIRSRRGAMRAAF